MMVLRKKTREQTRNRKLKWNLEVGGGWSGWSLPSLPFDMNMYVKTIMFIVKDGSISSFEK